MYAAVATNLLLPTTNYNCTTTYLLEFAIWTSGATPHDQEPEGLGQPTGLRTHKYAQAMRLPHQTGSMIRVLPDPDAFCGRRPITLACAFRRAKSNAPDDVKEIPTPDAS